MKVKCERIAAWFYILYTAVLLQNWYSPQIRQLYRIKSKAAISLSIDLRCKTIAALFLYQYCCLQNTKYQSKAAISLSIDLHCKAIAALYRYQYNCCLQNLRNLPQNIGVISCSYGIIWLVVVARKKCL